MAENDTNIGRDVTLDINDPRQGIVRFALLTGFDAKPQFNKLESKALDGIPRFRAVPHGHRITFNFDRQDRSIDDYFAAQEENYFNGGRSPLVTITETIQELDGSASQWVYSGVSMTLEDGGTWKGDAITTQSIEAMASRKRKVK